MKRKPTGSRSDPVRSVRVSDETWAMAQRRAQYEGVTMSHVMLTIVEGYAKGLLDLPRVQVIYKPMASAVGE